MGMDMNHQDVPKAEDAKAVTQKGSEDAATQPDIETSTHKGMKEVTAEKANVGGEPESTQSTEGATQRDEYPSGEKPLPEPKDEPANDEKR